MTDTITITEYAMMHALTPSAVKKACQTGRICGAFKDGAKWMIPKDAIYATTKPAILNAYVADYCAGIPVNKPSFARDMLLSFGTEEDLINYLRRLPDDLIWVFAEYADDVLNTLPVNQLPDYLHPGALESIIQESWWRANSRRLYDKARWKGLPPSIRCKADYDASMSDWDKTQAMLCAYANDLVKESAIDTITERLIRAMSLYGEEILRVYDGILPTVAGKRLSFDEDQLRRAAVDAWWTSIDGMVDINHDRNGHRSLVKATTVKGYNKYTLPLKIREWYDQMIQGGPLYPVIP